MIYLQALPNILSGFDVASVVRMLLWASIIIAVIVGFVMYMRNRMKYAYVGCVLRRRQETIDGIPQSVIVFGKAGYFVKKSGKWVFRIKYGKMPWHIVEVSDTPDPEHMVGNMAFFFQLDKDNVVQAKMGVDWEGQKVKLIPVKDDLKFSHFLDMREVDMILGTKQMNPIIVGMSIMGLILVTGIIVFYYINGGG